MSPELINLINLVVIGAFVIEAVAVVMSGAYIWWVYRQRRGDALYLAQLVRQDLRVVMGVVVMGVLLVYNAIRFAFPAYGLPVIPPPFGLLAFAIPIAVFMWGVIAHALQFRRDRRFRP